MARAGAECETGAILPSPPRPAQPFVIIKWATFVVCARRPAEHTRRPFRPARPPVVSPLPGAGATTGGPGRAHMHTGQTEGAPLNPAVRPADTGCPRGGAAFRRRYASRAPTGKSPPELGAWGARGPTAVNSKPPKQCRLHTFMLGGSSNQCPRRPHRARPPPHPHRASQRACRETGPTITNNSSCGYRMEPRVMSGRFAHTLLAHMCFGAPRVAYHRMAAAATRPARSHGSARRRARAGASPGFRPRLRNRTEPVRDPPPAHTQTGRARPGTCRGPRRWKPGNRTMPAGTAAEERGASVAGQRCVRPPRRHQWCHGCDAWTTIRPSAI